MALVNGSIWYRDRNGWYVDPEVERNYGSSVLQNLILDARQSWGDSKDVTAQAAATCRTELRRYIEQPPDSMPHVQPEAFVNTFVHAHGGGAFNLTCPNDTDRYNKPDMLSLKGVMLRWAPQAVECRYDLLDPMPAALTDLIAHYGELLLKRLARNLIRPVKSIDTFTSEVGNYGKTGLGNLLMRALPSAVFKADATKMQQQLTGSSEFSELTGFMTTHKLVILDELDKLDKALTLSTVNSLTAENLRVRRMNENPVWVPRTANLFLMGGGIPKAQMGQGSDERFEWAYRPDNAKPISDQLNQWMRYSPEAPAIFAAYMIRLCAEVHANDDTNRAETRQQASELVNAQIADLVEAVESTMEFTDAGDDFVTNAELWERLERFPDFDIDRRRDSGTNMARAVSHIAGQAVTTAQRSGDKARGYRGWKLRSVGGQGEE